MKKIYLSFIFFCNTCSSFYNNNDSLPYKTSILFPKTKLSIDFSPKLYFYFEKINNWNEIIALLEGKNLKQTASNTQLRKKINALFGKYNYKEEIQRLKKSKKWDKAFFYGSLALLVVWGSIMANHAYSLKTAPRSLSPNRSQGLMDLKSLKK